MIGDLQSEDLKMEMELWFFQKPKDTIPTLRTKVIDLDEDGRGRVLVLGNGIGEWFPIYHFRKANPEIEKFSSTVPIQECDDLYKRLDI